MDEAIEATDALWRALADRYRVDGLLGRGGMATVFVATDLRHQRRVAIKVLRPEVGSALGTARFLREISIASGLTHSHLVPLYDSGEAANRLYYVMPLIEGETLRARLKRERQLSLEDALRITLDVAEGLGYAHEHGIVHRDVKPENILLQGGRALVADFGIARAIAASTESVTTSGIVIGTVPYMSPEQAAGEPELDARSDLYSLGCVLYEMLTGEPPFTGATAQAIIARHIAERAPSIAVVRPDLPEAVDAMVRRALAKTPADRFATAADFSAAVRACTAPNRTKSRRLRRLATLVPVVALLAGAAFLTAKKALGGALHDQDWLLVADFDGPSSDPRLATAVRDLVTQSLRQSRYVRLVDRRQLNDLMRNAGIPETTHVDAARARELAARSSIRAILRGGIRRLDTTTYEVVLHVIGVENGKSLVSVVNTSTEAGLPEAMDALSRDLRAQLGERHSELVVNRPARVVATPSFAAFRLYSAAADAIVMHGDINTSNALLREAVRLDSAFAIAWSYLASNYVNARQIDSARVAYGRALAHAERMSVADDYRLKGDVAYALDHDLRAAVKWYDLYLAEAPSSSSGRMNRGFYLAALGEYEQALSDFEQAVALSPFGADQLQPELNNEAAVLVSLGRLREARRVSSHLSGPFAQVMEIMIPAADSHWASAESAAASALPKSPPGFLRSNAVSAYASALAAQGAARAADSVLSKEAETSTGAARRLCERLRLLLAIASGRTIAPRQGLLSGDTTAAGNVTRALLEAAAGDTTAARLHLAKLATLGARDSVVVGTGPLVVEALIAGRAKNDRRIVDLLGKAALAGEYDAALLDRPDSFLMRWITASAYERLERLDSAAAYYELVVRPTRIPPLHYSIRGICYGFALRHLAAINERRGDRASALRQLDALLDAFQKPDSTVAPLIVDARRTRARLVARVAWTPTPTFQLPIPSTGVKHVPRSTRFAVRDIGRSRRHRGLQHQAATIASRER